MHTKSLLTLLFAMVFVNTANATVNLIKNGDAETGLGGNSQVVVVPNWQDLTGNFTVIKYDIGGGYLASGDPGPSDRGLNYFSGGTNNLYSSAYQVTDILDNAGNAGFYASGYFGGFAGQTDYSQLTIQFLDVNASVISFVTFGSTTPSERGGVTGLLFKEITGVTPVGTTQIAFKLEMQREQGSANDGYADNLFFSITPVPEANTVSMLLVGLGLLGLMAKRKKQDI
jgi:hypothetical protein